MCCKSHPNVLALFAERQQTDDRPRRADADGVRAAHDRARRHERARGRAGLQRDGRLHHGLRDDGERPDVRRRHDASKEATDAGRRSPTMLCRRRQLPCVAAALPHLASCDPDEQFAFGLDLLLAGLQATVRPSRRVPLDQRELATDAAEDLERLARGRPRCDRRSRSCAPAPGPSPTVGNTIAGQNTPSSKSRRANACVGLLVAGDHRRDRRLARARCRSRASCRPSLNELGVRPQPSEPVGLVVDDRRAPRCRRRPRPAGRSSRTGTGDRGSAATRSGAPGRR